MESEACLQAVETIIWRNAKIATVSEIAGGLGLIEAGVMITSGERLIHVGPEAELPSAALIGREVIDLGGRLVTPAFVDCHTHLVFGGDRAKEFEMRLAGGSYEDIARAGGGIVSTVRATNELSEDELIVQALPRLDTLLAEGVCTIEIKSGYGLNVAAELKMLRVARRLASLRHVRVLTTYLAAHALPDQYRNRRAEYIALEVLPGLEQAAAEGIADAVDGFCEGIAFSPAEIALVFDKAKELGLPVKLHAEQLSNLGGAKLAASYNALSADHLEYLDLDGVKAMANAGTVAVLLPGAFYTLKEKQSPPVGLLREAGVPIAIATDCNPGTSPLTSLLLTMNMSATLFGLTVDECLAGVTREASRALGLLSDTGTLEVGKSADFIVWNVERPAELVYRIGFNPIHARIFKGKNTR
ncbi:imidazolonepropionase [Agrobacterium tumefaciens]|uniref:imidazolonepropionase n=1 Tax=Agrobacterium tumefaciens TaxID=358 RepID=UPI00054F4F61